MQGLVDGYFVISYTIGGYFAGTDLPLITTGHSAFTEAVQQDQAKLKKLMAIQGKRTVDNIFRELGKIMWEYCGMSRNAEGLEKGLKLIQNLRSEFWEDVLVPGTEKDFNKSLEKAGRLADGLDFAETMVVDALARNESCGSHFRLEFQTDDGEAQRDDENFCHVSIWQYQGEGKLPAFHKEPLSFENVELSQRSYK